MFLHKNGLKEHLFVFLFFTTLLFHCFFFNFIYAFHFFHFFFFAVGFFFLVVPPPAFLIFISFLFPVFLLPLAESESNLLT